MMHGGSRRSSAPGLLGRNVMLDAVPEVTGRMRGYGFAPTAPLSARNQVVSKFLECQPSLFQQRVEVLKLCPQPGWPFRGIFLAAGKV